MLKKITSLIIILIIMCGCSKKVALGPNEFKLQMNNNKYNVIDVTDNYQYEGIVKAYKASNKKIDLIYYKLKTVEQSINFFETSRINLDLNKVNNKKETNISSNYYSKYSLTNNDSYLVISRIDSTLIYCSVDKKYQKEVNRIMKRLGY